MKLLITFLLMSMSAPSFAARGCMPWECPVPACPEQGTGKKPPVRAQSLKLNLSENEEIVSTSTGILIDTPWKNAIYNFSLKNIRHPSWGITHSERNYQMTKILAEKEKVDIDLDVLFAASFLHDLGGLKGYEVAGVDHAIRSTELAEKLLSDSGFPMEKWAAVKEIILGHTYYTAIPKNKGAQLFRDADVLDFLGTIGVSRILAITLEEGTSDSTLNPTVGILKQFAATMGSKCISEACKELARPRLIELKQFLKRLDAESFAGKAL